MPEITPSDPVQISKLIGRMELSLTLKQNEVLPGAKVSQAFLVFKIIGYVGLFLTVHKNGEIFTIQKDRLRFCFRFTTFNTNVYV